MDRKLQPGSLTMPFTDENQTQSPWKDFSELIASIIFFTINERSKNCS